MTGDNVLRFGVYSRRETVVSPGQGVQLQDFSLAISFLPLSVYLDTYVGVRFRISGDDHYEIRLYRVYIASCRLELWDSRGGQVWQTDDFTQGCDDGIEDYLVMNVHNGLVSVEFNGLDMVSDQSLGTEQSTLGSGSIALVTYATDVEVYFVVISEP